MKNTKQKPVNLNIMKIIKKIIFNKKHKIIKNHYEQTGASAVELAFILPILVMVIFGIFQFGIAYNNWIALTHAAREGARLAAVGKYDEQTIRDRAPTVQIQSIDIDGLEGKIGEPVTVTVTGYVLDIQIPFAGHWPVQLSSTATMRLETTD